MMYLSGFSDIKLSDEVFDKVKSERSYSEKKIFDFKIGESVKMRAIIVQVFEPRFFEICSECNKKLIDGNCSVHGKVIPRKRAVLTIIIDDGSENIRAVLFNEQIEKLGINEEELEKPELFLKKREEFLGKEAIFSGDVRKNKIFNNIEFFINDIEEFNIEKTIEKLQK